MSATQHLKEISPSLRLLPTLWFRNTWSWGYDNGPMGDVPGRTRLWRIMDTGALVQVEHPAAGTYYLWAEHANELLFTENESNNARLFGTPNCAPFVKDAFHHYVVNGAGEAVNPEQEGTKCAAHYALDIMAGETMTVRLRLARTRHERPFNKFAAIFDERLAEADEEFLSPYGIRSLSKVHSKPYIITIDDETFGINYQPAESESGLFGGNSNWRGPVWFPINFLLIEALRSYHSYFGDELQVEFPTGSDNMFNLGQVAEALSERLCCLFLRDETGKRPIYGGTAVFQEDPSWSNLILFNEYFHGDNGAGLGASHQTGWTGLVANLIQQSGRAQ